MTLINRRKAIQSRLGVKPDDNYGPITVTALERALDERDALKAAGGSPVPPNSVSGAVAHPGSDPTKFFDLIRNRFGRLSTAQVQGFEFLLGKMSAANWPIAWAAYGLATAWHETAQRMQPVREGLDVSDAYRRKHFRYYPHYGRGYPQTTWLENYERADEELGLGGTLIANPDRMLEPEIAADTMIRGMAEGWFSKDKQGPRSLSRYLPRDRNATREEFRQARPIINIMDKADKIAGEAEAIQAALQAGGWA
jgi:putative chitinase